MYEISLLLLTNSCGEALLISMKFSKLFISINLKLTLENKIFLEMRLSFHKPDKYSKIILC